MLQRFEVILLEEAFRFIESHPIKVRKKVLQTIRRAQFELNPALFKKLQKDIWEFRIRYGGFHYRLFAFWDKTDSNTMVLATHGIVKKTGTIEKREVNKALRIRHEYFRLKN